MGGAAGGRLAVAMSEAGGLGMIGIGSAGSVELLECEARIPRAAGVRYGIGLLAWAIERDPELLDCAITASPDLIAVSFGAPEGWPECVRAAGIATATQVYDVAMAQHAQETGVEILVAQATPRLRRRWHGVRGLYRIDAARSSPPTDRRRDRTRHRLHPVEATTRHLLAYERSDPKTREPPQCRSSSVAQTRADLPRTQPSRRSQGYVLVDGALALRHVLGSRTRGADGCFARRMREPHCANLTSGAHYCIRRASDSWFRQEAIVPARSSQLRVSREDDSR